MKNNIQQISDSYLCSSCGACNAVCSKNAIDFHLTNIGRLKADVNNNCIECGQCLKVCPSYTPIDFNEISDPYIGIIKNTYIGRAVDNEIYKNSQSGGVCTALTTYLLETKKVDAVVVCKICSGKKPNPKAVIIRNKEDLKDCQRSCYTQLDLLSALCEIDTKDRIALVGIPCQIEGLTLLQHATKKYNNIIYKIGLICDRVHCFGYEETILSYTPKSVNRYICWRKKDFSYNDIYYSYKYAPVVISDEKGRMSIFPNQFRFSLKDIFTTPRCRVCRDKLNVYADIVLGDPWGMSGVDWKHGSSVVLSRSAKGQELLDEAVQSSVITLSPASTEEMLQGQNVHGKKESVALYIQAFQMVFPTKNTWLINNKEDIPLDSDKIGVAQKELIDFCNRERKTKREIIREGQKRIAFATGIWHPALFGFRVIRKIKEILYNINRFIRL